MPFGRLPADPNVFLSSHFPGLADDVLFYSIFLMATSTIWGIIFLMVDFWDLALLKKTIDWAVDSQVDFVGVPLKSRICLASKRRKPRGKQCGI